MATGAFEGFLGAEIAKVGATRQLGMGRWYRKPRRLASHRRLERCLDFLADLGTERQGGRHDAADGDFYGWLIRKALLSSSQLLPFRLADTQHASSVPRAKLDLKELCLMAGHPLEVQLTLRGF